MTYKETKAIAHILSHLFIYYLGPIFIFYFFSNFSIFICISPYGKHLEMATIIPSTEILFFVHFKRKIDTLKYEFHLWSTLPVQHAGFPNQGSNPCPLHWEPRVSNTGLLRNPYIFKNYLLKVFLPMVLGFYSEQLISTPPP